MSDYVKKVLLLIVDVVLAYFIFVGVNLLPAQFSDELKFIILILGMTFLIIPSLLYWIEKGW